MKVALAAGYEKAFLVEGFDKLTDPELIGTVYDVRASTIGPGGVPCEPAFCLNDGRGGHGADMLADLLSVVLPLVPADPLRVIAKAWSPGGELAQDLRRENRIKAVVNFANGAQADLLVACEGYPGLVEGTELRISGSRWSGQIPIIGAECDRGTGLAAQARNWVDACRGGEELRSCPKVAYRTHLVMAGVFHSVRFRGKEVEIAQPAV